MANDSVANTKTFTVLSNIKHGFGGGNGTWCVTSVDFLDFRNFRMCGLVKNLRTFEVSTLIECNAISF